MNIVWCDVVKLSFDHSITKLLPVVPNRQFGPKLINADVGKSMFDVPVI